MDNEVANEIIACLPSDRTLFHYYRDKYAIYLLEKLVSKQPNITVREIKASAWAGLLNKPVLKEVLQHCGNGQLTSEALRLYWPKEVEPYVLTLGKWGADAFELGQQTSRKGVNLVLHLNFNNYHNMEFRMLTKFAGKQYFNSYSHPVSGRSANTLAWARIDLDLEENCALIEEVQTDWIRYAKWYVSYAKRVGEDAFAEIYDGASYKGLMRYYEEELKRHEKMWSEAMLTAALWFVFDELGIDNVFYHSYETGAQLKGIAEVLPPRSLYRDLPKRFCFERVQGGPQFICQDKAARRRLKKVKQPAWFKMAA